MSLKFLTGGSLGLLLLLLAAGVVIFYLFVYRRESKRLTPRQRTILRTLRIVAALAVLAALARPALTVVRHEQRLPVLPVLVDASASMAYPDTRENPLAQANPPDRRRRYDTAQAALDRLQRQFTLTHRVQVYTFSDTLKLAKELPRRARASDPALDRAEILAEVPDPIGEYSNVGDALADTLRELSEEHVSGVILLTDGRQTGGLPLKEAGAQAASAKIPVHTVALGTEFPLTDLRIDEVIAEPEISLGDVLRFRLKIVNQVRAPLATRLSLYEEGKPVNAKNLTLARGESAVELATIPETEGLRTFRLALPVYDDEIDKQNNEAVVRVRVVKKTLRVLLIAGNPSREFFFLVPALMRDPVVDLSCWLQSADIDYVQQGNTNIERLPRSVDEWKKFDVVLLFDVDPNKITSQQVAEMEQMVRTGGGLMVTGGRNHGLAKLIQVHAVKVRELLPVEIDKNALPDYYQMFEQPFACERTPTGRGHPLLRMDRDDATNERVWASFPQCFWAHPVAGVKPKSIVLLRSVDTPASRGQPLLAVHRYFEGSVAYLGLDTLWRWRYPHETYDFDRIWSNVIRYLGETRLKGGQKQVALSTDRTSYAPGEEVALRLRVMDPALMSQLEGQPLMVSVTGPQGERQMVVMRPDVSGEMLYTGAYRARRVGSMVAQAKQLAAGAASDAKPLFDVSHPFLVKLQSLETRDTSGDLDGLRALARQTGGKSYDYRNANALDELFAAIPHDPHVLSREMTVEAWDGTVFLLIFLMLVGTELSLRKWWGLL